jgi:adenylosuccinate lyase
MVKDAQTKVLTPALHQLLKQLALQIEKYPNLPMLARTHGQPAIPTTFGKELSVFAIRLLNQIQALNHTPLTGKLNGAVGGFHAQTFVYPNIDWPKTSDTFISSFGLMPNHHTTQINPPDDLITLLHHYHLLHSILIGLCQDCWRYISDDWLFQTGKTKYVGSSTMPQKINPIEFENAEGNLTLTNGLIETLARKLPISRLQRDLSDSTVMRHLGVIFGHQLVAVNSLTRGLNSLTPNTPKITRDLNANYAILGEALQTYLRTQGQSDAYESVAKPFKTKVLSQNDWFSLVRAYDHPPLLNLTPQTYLGLAPQLAKEAYQRINQYFKEVKYDPKSI